jgi:tRNA/rRNA methyltransferase
LASESNPVRVVLVSPRNPLNIGAATRAMANFGFSDLAVVAPYEPHWREAKSAVGAEELLNNAHCTETLAEAVAACTLIIGTGTLTHRKPEQPVVSLPDLAAYIESKGAARIALVFGPEKHGLTREDLSWCHLLVEIPTDPRQPSMNLGQAVAVCLYELASHGFSHPAAESTSLQTNPPAPSASLDLLAGVIEQTMAAAGYSPRTMQPANRHDLRLLLRRLSPSARDTRRMLGLFRRILWRLHPDRKGK